MFSRVLNRFASNLSLSLTHQFPANRIPVIASSISSSFPSLPSSFIRSFTYPANVKLSTNIAGLPVVPNGREVLIGLYKETLRLIAGYEKNQMNDATRRWTEYRLRVCEANPDIPSIEKAMDMGSQIEEMIDMAEEELDLLVVFNEDLKPWDNSDPNDLEPALNGGWAMEDHDVDDTTDWDKDDDSVWADIDKELGFEGHNIKGPMGDFKGKTWRDAILHARKNFKLPQ